MAFVPFAMFLGCRSRIAASSIEYLECFLSVTNIRAYNDGNKRETKFVMTRVHLFNGCFPWQIRMMYFRADTVFNLGCLWKGYNKLWSTVPHKLSWQKHFANCYQNSNFTNIFSQWRLCFILKYCIIISLHGQSEHRDFLSCWSHGSHCTCSMLCQVSPCCPGRPL